MLSSDCLPPLPEDDHQTAQHAAAVGVVRHRPGSRTVGPCCRPGRRHGDAPRRQWFEPRGPRGRARTRGAGPRVPGLDRRAARTPAPPAACSARDRRRGAGARFASALGPAAALEDRPSRRGGSDLGARDPAERLRLGGLGQPRGRPHDVGRSGVHADRLGPTSHELAGASGRVRGRAPGCPARDAGGGSAGLRGGRRAGRGRGCCARRRHARGVQDPGRFPQPGRTDDLCPDPRGPGPHPAVRPRPGAAAHGRHGRRPGYPA